MNSSMTPDEFAFALERYGGELSQWPPALRAPAEALLAGSPAAIAALERARTLDRFLRANDPAASIEPERCAEIARRVMLQTRDAAGDHGGTVWRWSSLVLRIAAPTRIPALRFAATALTAATLGVLAGRGLTQLTGGTPAHVVAGTGVAGTTDGLAALLSQPQLMIAELQ